MNRRNHVSALALKQATSTIPIVFRLSIELYVNRKTAAELGLTIPLEVLVRANEVIE